MSLTDMLIGAATIAGLGIFSYGCNVLKNNHYISVKEESQKKYNAEEKELADDYAFFSKFGVNKEWEQKKILKK